MTEMFVGMSFKHMATCHKHSIAWHATPLLKRSVDTELGTQCVRPVLCPLQTRYTP